MASQAPPITVLMPVFRPDPTHFPYAIESVLDQTFTDYELLVMESASAQPAKPWLANVSDHRIRHHVVPPVNRTALLNQGVERARGALIAIVDSSDIALPERLETQIAVLDSDPAIAVLGSFIEWIDEQNRPLGFQTLPTESKAIRQALRRCNPIVARTSIFWKRAILSEGGFRGEETVADYEIWGRMARTEASFANVPLALTRCRRLPAHWDRPRLAHQLVAEMEIRAKMFAEEAGIRTKWQRVYERMLLRLPLDAPLRCWMVPRLRKALATGK
ncbi:Putative glycosyltransferase EpsE [Rosistilla carotiformis]|uniref:Glycosyltransferase EpsE n=1 Tax=Rosistilla carotiformis TaxID=2528017 RepID=A0A518JTD8_9BACT|nr:glycosyltransferase [Rosistilla carotiformis]QDV68807.1 Putative glycosyltransferase EpsE [Rosistilla carotiformis]